MVQTFRNVKRNFLGDGLFLNAHQQLTTWQSGGLEVLTVTGL